MKSLSSWSGVVALSLLLLTLVLFTVGIGYGLIAGLCIGIGFGTAFGIAIATSVHADDRRRDRQHLDQVLYEHLSPNIVYEPDPLAVEAIGKLTEKAVLNGFCCYCGSDHDGLDAERFHPAYHRQNPLCPVPLSRKIYEQAIAQPDPMPAIPWTAPATKKLLPSHR
jgi:hypothetical protein